MSGFQLPNGPTLRFSNGPPPAPVVPRERVKRDEPKNEPRVPFPLEAEGKLPAWLAEIAHKFPETSNGGCRNWVQLAELYKRNRFKPITWYGEQVGLHHASVLYALRKMGLYESRNSPEWKAAFQRRQNKIERQRSYDRQRRGVFRDEARFKRLAIEGTSAPYNAKITPVEVRKIRQLYDAGMERKQIARLFRLSLGQVCAIGRRERWRHVR